MNKITRLMDVKSIITITLTMVFAYLAVVERVDIEQIYIMIVSFYFGTQHQKIEDREIDKK